MSILLKFRFAYILSQVQSFCLFEIKKMFYTYKSVHFFIPWSPGQEAVNFGELGAPYNSIF